MAARFIAPLSLIALVAAFLANASVAQSYPARPVRLVVPVPPGGAGDFTGRIVGAKLAESLGQNVVVENRGGATGTIASELVARAAPDGYTLMLTSSTTHGSVPVIYKKLPYDALKDFTHIGLISTVPMILAVNQSVPAYSVKEFVALAKAKPNTLLYGSSGAGSPPHLLGELFRSITGAPISHVPYKGSGPAIVDLVGGQIQVMFDGPPSLIGQIKTGKIRPLAAVSSRRSTLLPDIPTMAESGIPGVEASIWFGLSGAAGMPPRVVERLSREIFRLTALDDVRERFGTVGAFSSPLGTKEYAEFIRSEMAKWEPVVKSANITLD